MFTIPPALQITSHQTASDILPVPDALWDGQAKNISHWSEHVAVAAWILRQQAEGSRSFWEPYIHMLPPRIPSPVFFPDHVLQQLQLKDFVDGVGESATDVMSHAWVVDTYVSTYVMVHEHCIRCSVLYTMLPLPTVLLSTRTHPVECRAQSVSASS